MEDIWKPKVVNKKPLYLMIERDSAKSKYKLDQIDQNCMIYLTRAQAL